MLLYSAPPPGDGNQTVGPLAGSSKGLSEGCASSARSDYGHERSPAGSRRAPLAGNTGRRFVEPMSNRLQQLGVFVRAAETGSFSRAARELGLSQPSVSRIINELEPRLEVKLLLRNTRQIVPTEAGIANRFEAIGLPICPSPMKPISNQTLHCSVVALGCSPVSEPSPPRSPWAGIPNISRLSAL